MQIVANTQNIKVHFIHDGQAKQVSIVAWIETWNNDDKESANSLRLIPLVLDEYTGEAVTVLEFFSNKDSGYNNVEIGTIKFAQ